MSKLSTSHLGGIKSKKIFNYSQYPFVLLLTMADQGRAICSGICSGIYFNLLECIQTGRDHVPTVACISLEPAANQAWLTMGICCSLKIELDAETDR